jgi:hypothetical protein
MKTESIVGGVGALEPCGIDFWQSVGIGIGFLLKCRFSVGIGIGFGIEESRVFGSFSYVFFFLQKLFFVVAWMDV